jgi:hypothetical protein
VSADTADKLNRIIDSSEKIHQLRLKRMQLLSLPAASVSGRNKELLSLAIGAVSGALSLSFHPACALIFIFSYRMYRKASEPTRERLAGATNARAVQAEITTETAELDALVSEMRSSLQSIEEKSIESTQQSRSATS